MGRIRRFFENTCQNHAKSARFVRYVKKHKNFGE